MVIYYHKYNIYIYTHIYITSIRGGKQEGIELGLVSVEENHGFLERYNP